MSATLIFLSDALAQHRGARRPDPTDELSEIARRRIAQECLTVAEFVADAIAATEGVAVEVERFRVTKLTAACYLVVFRTEGGHVECTVCWVASQAALEFVPYGERYPYSAYFRNVTRVTDRFVDAVVYASGAAD